MSNTFDVVVIGGGPGGYVAAVRASQLGMKVAVVERENLGGICLNWGCIPTKALLKASEIFHSIQHASDFGIKVGKPDVDVKKLIARSRDVSSQLNTGVGFLMKKNGVEVFEGEASFKNRSTLTVKNGKQKEEISFKNAIIATGARARTIPGVLEADGKNIWTYREAMTPEKMPKSLLVVGAGAIGVEFASFYQTLGCKVTIVEGLNRILPVEDAEISKRAKKALEKTGMNIITGAKVSNLKSGRSSVSADIEVKGKSKTEKFDKVLLAIGVQGNIEGLNLDKIDVKTERDLVKVDATYRTNVPNIYAIGDIVGKQQLAHVASHEGVIAAEAIAGMDVHPMDYENIPGCTYCTPQVASVGLTEEKAKERGIAVKVGRFDYQANGKALAIGENEGLVKTIFDADTGALLGAHIIGAEATEMISTFVLGRQLETTEEDMIHACLPHPTLSEMIGESVLDSEDRALNA